MATTLFPFLLLLSFSISALGLQTSHVVDVHSLVPSNVCSSPKDANPRLRVADRHGPCSSLPSSKSTSPEEILSKDQLRVDSIQNHVAAFSGQANNLTSSRIKARYGGSFGVANYIVSIGIGTPSKTQTVVFDTGSDVTWVQCEPCEGFCYSQKEPIFDPSQSSTFTNVSCNSTECNAVSYGCSSSLSCLYGVGYGDGSFTLGYYAADKLTLGADVIEKFRFGCGQDNDGLFGEVAGLLALGPYPESFVSQTSDKYHRIFSYCLPPPSRSGYLKFGSDCYTPNTQRTPIPGNPNESLYYYINMTGLSVAGTPLRIQPKVFIKSGTIIDSGTVITRLPPDAYKALRSEFRKHMKQYKMIPGISLFDTCYNFTGVDKIEIPSVGVQFLNGVSLDLDFRGILYVFDISQVCLAFASNPRRTNLGIFGNVQQRTFNVVYDVANGEIGFSPDAC